MGVNHRGRKAGVPNKITTEVKTAILEAFQSTRGGKGKEFLIRLKEKKPEVYCRLLEKVLPAELKIDPASAGLILEIRDYTGGKSGGIITEDDEKTDRGGQSVH